MEEYVTDVNFVQDITEYQICVSNEIESRLKCKCEKLADALIDDNGWSPSFEC